MDLFRSRTVVIATMHGKEQAIAPLLEAEFDLKIKVPPDFNTDQFGTFTREIARTGDQIEAARQKALFAIKKTGCDLAIASEGSFAPHPTLPMLPCDREIILLIDTMNNLEIMGEVISLETNFSHRKVSNIEQAREFALKIGFPEHKLVVIDHEHITKGVGDFEQLEQLINAASKPVHIETDMRAMNNPTRMKAIAKATQDLVKKLKSSCPNCSKPGFSVAEVKRGLPCGWCSVPTDLISGEIYRCQHCGFEQLLLSEIQIADPMYCAFCNP
jgi:ribosomal protein S27AE